MTFKLRYDEFLEGGNTKQRLGSVYTDLLVIAVIAKNGYSTLFSESLTLTV